MKKLLPLITLAIILFGIQTAFAQTPKRIQFAKGKSSATVKGNTGTNGVYYVVKTGNNQVMTLTLTPTTKVGIKVEHDGANGQEVVLREEKGGTYELTLEEGGDYTIFLGSTNGKSQSFTLTVKIRNFRDI